MLGFGSSPDQPAPADDLIRDVSEAEFMDAVVQASMETPVIVDFWAEWCGPCKTLGPMLEDAVRKQNGKVRMAKVDVDRNQRLVQMLAQQGLPMQSIPTVVGFVQGQIADMFQGALPQSQIEAFVAKLAEAGSADGLAEAVAAAEEMLEAGAAVDAAQTFAAILGEAPENAAAFGGLVRAHLALGETDKAEQLLASAPDAVAGTPEVEAARAQVALSKQAANAGPVADLRAAVEADADDHQARYDLAGALQASGDTEGAVDELLELFRRDREWNEGAARAQLFTIFDSLKPNDPIVLKGRRRLGSMVLA